MDYIIVFFSSMVPLFEQRFAIPYGVAKGLNPVLVLLVSLIGSLVPCPFILIGFNKLLEFMKKFSWLDWFTNFIDKKIRKNLAKFEKQQEIALIVFIGIPLPTTGIWTGSAIAAFLGLNFKKSVLCALVGGIISAIAIVLLSVYAKGAFFN